jgi:translation initiation factor IF-2
VRIPEAITVKELADRLEVSAGELMKRLIKMGVMATINQPLELEVAKAAAAKFGLEVEAAPVEEQAHEVAEVEDPALLRPRAPVVTVMGHVDHGKTSLLDAIRHTNVMATEAGGITQHIGAYQVEVPGHAVDRVVFLDTPGHEAFTAMRARGAQVTDIVVLVVAADDGVMPQTVEAINHAKAAKVPILVAVNKIDKPNADPNRVKQQLAELGLTPEEWGGDTIYVPVSAKRREGIENLLDNLLVLAEVQELKANPSRLARGTVVEAHLDKGRGPVATVLVQQGTLHVGDAVVAGLHHGRVRALLNDKGRKVQEGGPATPVEVLGLSGVPMAGDVFGVAGDERKARTIALARQQKAREEAMAAQRRLTLEDLHQQIARGEVKELPIILKADVQGSIEALREALERLSTDAVKLRVIHDSVGAISETDVMLASASNAIIVGFNVRPAPQAQKLAEQERVDVRLHTVIYQALDEIRSAMVGLLEPKFEERPVGRVEVRETFNISRVGTVAGSYVVEGKVTRDGLVRVVRDGRVVHTGRVGSLRRFKEDVSEVTAGYECGIGLANFNDVKVGDVLEVYEMEEVAPHL